MPRKQLPPPSGRKRSRGSAASRKAEALIAQAVEIARMKLAKAMKDRAVLSIRLATAERTISEMERMIAVLDGRPVLIQQSYPKAAVELPPALEPLAGSDAPADARSALARAAARVDGDFAQMGSISAGGQVSQDEISGDPEGDEEDEGKFLPNIGTGWR